MLSNQNSAQLIFQAHLWSSILVFIGVQHGAAINVLRKDASWFDTQVFYTSRSNNVVSNVGMCE
jgi:hypothetical protein